MDLHRDSKLNNEWRVFAEKGRSIASQIRALKWKVGSETEMTALRGERCSLGRPIHGKKALKSFRRPETGPERAALWDEKRRIGATARELSLCKGILRQKVYARLERKCIERHRPSAERLAEIVRGYLPEHARADFTGEAVTAWFNGSPPPKARNLTVEETYAFYGPRRKPGLLSRIGTLLGGGST